MNYRRGIAEGRARRHIEKRRREKGLTQEELALALDIDRSYITRIASGRKPISLDHIDKLAAVLDCDVSEFFTVEKEEG